MSEQGVGPGEREALEQARVRMVALRREQYRLLEDIAELERLGVAQQTGDRFTQGLLQDVWLADRAEAKRLVDESADLTPRRSLGGELLPARLPCTAVVAADGRIGPGHIAVIRKAMARLERIDTITGGQLAECEQLLAEHATALPPRMLQKVADALINEFDPDGAAPPEGEDRFDELHVVRRKDGSLAIRGRIHDPVDAEIIWEVFDALSARSGPDDHREKPQRNAAALKDLAQDALGPHGLATDARLDGSEPQAEDGAEPEEDGPKQDEDEGDGQAALIPAPPRQRRSSRSDEPVRSAGRALLTITMDHRWLCEAIGHGTLDSGALVDPRTVRRWACDAEIIPMILGSRSEPLDVGRLSRTATESIRRALNLRDGGCAFPGCTRRPRRCHAHHIRQWLDGGDTCLENMTLLCRLHHQLIHRGHWTVQILDGRPWFTPPPWVDPEQHRRPGGRPSVRV